MRQFIFALILSATLISAPISVMAQNNGQSQKPRYNQIDDIQKYAYISGPRFEYMARIAKSSMPDLFNFTEFRMHYAQSRQYDPIGDETIEKMLKIAYTLDTTQDEDVYAESLAAYNNLVMDHMANLGVMMQASALAKTHKRYGDIDFYQWLKAGIIRDVLRSGDGYSLDGAYDVITMTEETVLFDYLGLKSLRVIPNNEGMIYYNMHDAKKMSGGMDYTIFVNTSYPMKFLEAKTELQRGFIYRLNEDLGFIKER